MWNNLNYNKFVGCANHLLKWYLAIQTKDQSCLFTLHSWFIQAISLASPSLILIILSFLQTINRSLRSKDLVPLLHTHSINHLTMYMMPLTLNTRLLIQLYLRDHKDNLLEGILPEKYKDRWLYQYRSIIYWGKSTQSFRENTNCLNKSIRN